MQKTQVKPLHDSRIALSVTVTTKSTAPFFKNIVKQTNFDDFLNRHASRIFSGSKTISFNVKKAE